MKRSNHKQNALRTTQVWKIQGRVNKESAEVMNIWKIMYENWGVKNYVTEDHLSHRHNSCSCEKKVWKKNSGFLFATVKAVSITAMICFHESAIPQTSSLNFRHLSGPLLTFQHNSIQMYAFIIIPIFMNIQNKGTPESSEQFFCKCTM